jgi:hypothetical protein
MARRIIIGIAAAAFGASAATAARAAMQGDMLATYAGALGIEAAAPEDAAPPLALAAAPLPGEELAGMRAGFALPGGMSLAFGFDIETRLGGVLVQRMTLPVTEIGGGVPRVEVYDAGAVHSVMAGQGPIVLDRSFNGGGTRVRTALDGGITSLVQNSRDGQLVQRRAAFQVDIAGMSRLLDAAASRRVIGDALGAGARGRP